MRFNQSIREAKEQIIDRSLLLALAVRPGFPPLKLVAVLSESHAEIGVVGLSAHAELALFGVGGLGVAGLAAGLLVLAVAHEQHQLLVSALYLRHQLFVFFIVDGQEGRHQHHRFYLVVVVAVVEELVEAVAGLLRFGDKEEVVLGVLQSCVLDVLEREAGDCLHEAVVDEQVLQVLDEHGQQLLVLQVVAAHLVEGILRTQNVVY